MDSGTVSCALSNDRDIIGWANLGNIDPLILESAL